MSNSKDFKFEPTDVYNRSELDAGQLDNRYYTETEIDNKPTSFKTML